MACRVCVARAWALASCLPQKTGVHTSAAVAADLWTGKEDMAGWRLRKGLAENRSRYGPLTDLPDYTFLDGRPTPLNKGQKRRRDERIQLAKRVSHLVREMEGAKGAKRQAEEEAAARRKAALDRKLKPKA